VSGGSVAVNQAFPSGAIEKAGGGALLFSGPGRRALQGGTERGLLGAVAGGGGA
jgi:hypothetical protein